MKEETRAIVDRVREAIRFKIWPEYFEAVLDGRKTFEVRKDDRPPEERIEAGRDMVLVEWDPAEVEGVKMAFGEFTGREILARATYVLRDSPLLRSGYIVASIVPVAVRLDRVHWRAIR